MKLFDCETGSGITLFEKRWSAQKRHSTFGRRANTANKSIGKWVRQTV